MKKYLLITTTMTVLLLLMQSLAPLKTTRRDGTDPGYTGSPGDTFKNCTKCHGGVATNISGWITSNVPSTGYIPGQTYKITAKNFSMGSTRFGFELSPQNLTGKLMGTLVVSDTHRTKLVGNNKYLTYREYGVDGTDSNTWSVDWVAPSAGSGEVVFYGAFNSNPGHKSNDGTHLSTLTLQEFGNAKSIHIPNGIGEMIIYPNPASDKLFVQLNLKTKSQILMEVFDLKGKRIALVANEIQFLNKLHNFDTQTLANGNYILKVTTNGKTVSEKFLVKH